MSATKILNRIIDKGGLLGAVAKTCLKDKHKKSTYLRECSEMCNTKLARDLWGIDLITDITEYSKGEEFSYKRVNPFSLSIIKKIKALRKQKGIKQEVIAGFLKMTQSSYSKIEDGFRPLTLDQFYVIASTLNTSITELLDISTEKKVTSKAISHDEMSV